MWQNDKNLGIDLLLKRQMLCFLSTVSVRSSIITSRQYWNLDQVLWKNVQWWLLDARASFFGNCSQLTNSLINLTMYSSIYFNSKLLPNAIFLYYFCTNRSKRKRCFILKNKRSSKCTLMNPSFYSVFVVGLSIWLNNRSIYLTLGISRLVTILEKNLWGLDMFYLSRINFLWIWFWQLGTAFKKINFQTFYKGFK